MTKQIFYLLVVLPSLLLGQSKKFELGIMIGNNGQLENTLRDFYAIEYINRYPPDNSRTNLLSIKFNATARYFINNNFSARIKFGKAIRNGLIVQTSPTGYFDYQFQQSVISICPSVCFSTRIDQFEIMTGLEIPLVSVGDYKVKTISKYIPDSINVSSSFDTKFTTTGGFICGINNFIGIKYYFTDWLSIGSEINYGLLSVKLGDKFIGEELDASSSQYNKYYEESRKYRKTFFSTPEISVGLLVQLGRNKTKKI